MLYLGLLLLFLILCFGFVLLFGAPYLPILAPQLTVALEMANLKPGETLLELGCGDGKVLIAAAQKGWRAVGYELNPLLVLLCIWRTRKYRKLVSVRWGNFMAADWPPAQAIFVFALQQRMPALDRKIQAYEHRPLKVVSPAFTIPGKQPSRQQAGLSLYQYKARSAKPA